MQIYFIFIGCAKNMIYIQWVTPRSVAFSDIFMIELKNDIAAQVKSTFHRK